jgi:hypothetical protein
MEDIGAAMWGEGIRAEEILDKNSFSRWLAYRPGITRSETIALAHRCALRVVPFLNRRGNLKAGVHIELLVRALWASAVTRAASMFPSQEIEFAATAACEFYDTISDARIFSSAISAVSHASEAVGSTHYDSHANSAALMAAYTVSSGTDHADEFSREMIVSRLGENIWAALRVDAVAVEAGTSIKQIMQSRIWEPDQLGNLQDPKWWEEEYAQFSSFLQSMRGDGWDIWDEWVDDVFTGGPVFGIRSESIRDTLERNIALGSTDGKFTEVFWKREPRLINADIKAWVEEAREEDRKASETLDDFSSRPASIETDVENGQVVLLHNKPITHLPEAIAQAAARDLANGLRDIADMAEKAQADRRASEFLRDAADRVENASDDQVALFESGRNQKTMQGYAATVLAEWNPLIAARYNALVIQFDETLQKFEAWRGFTQKHVKPSLPVPYESINQQLENFEVEIAQNASFIAPQVKSRLKRLLSLFKERYERWKEFSERNNEINSAVDGQIELLLEDVVVSIGNVIRSSAKLFWEQCGGKFVEGVGKQIPETSEALGRGLVKWGARGAVAWLLNSAFPGALTTLLEQIAVIATKMGW